MKKFKELNINEQHREKGRFKPTTPHNVPNVAAASPRPSSDSAEVRLKEAAPGDTSNFETPVGNQFRQGDSPAARSMLEKPQKEPMKKYKEVKEESDIEIPKDAPSVEDIAKKHGVSVDEIEKQLKIGMSIEAEHGKNKSSQREIAMDHLNEKPDYYKKLKKYVEETEKVNEMLKPKMSALDKFRQASAERSKKHDNIERDMQARHAAGKEDMKGSIDRLEKSLNKEEIEQILEYESKVGVYKHKGTYGTSYKGDIDPGNPKSAEDSIHLNKARTKNLEQGLGVHFGKISKVKEETELQEGQNKQVEGGDPCWKNYQMVGKKMKNGKEVPNCVPVKEAKDDDVGEMVKDKLKIIISRAQDMHDSIKGDASDMPEWVKSKVTLAQDYISTACDYSCGKEQLGEEMKKHPFVAVHAKKGTHETHGSTSYEAAQNAAKHWKMKNTAGIDVYRADKTHVAEEVEQINELSKRTLGSYVKKATSSGDERSMSNLASRAAAKLASARDGGRGDSGHDDDHKSFLRSKGVSKAVDRLTNTVGWSEEVEQIDEAPVVIKTNKPIGSRVTSIGPGGKETVIKSDPPFEGPYTKVKKTITDKSGAKHTPMSRAKDLARMALSKQSKALKPVVKEEKDDSRKAEIVKNVMKSAKKKKSESAGDDKFESEPVLSSEIQKQ